MRIKAKPKRGILPPLWMGKQEFIHLQKNQAPSCIVGTWEKCHNWTFFLLIPHNLYCWAWHCMVWDIPLVSESQLSRLCSLPNSHALHPACFKDAWEALDNHFIQEVVYAFLGRKLALSQSKPVQELRDMVSLCLSKQKIIIKKKQTDKILIFSIVPVLEPYQNTCGMSSICITDRRKRMNSEG